MTVDFTNALENNSQETPNTFDELASRLAYLRLVQKNIKDQLEAVKKRLASDPDLLLYQCFLSDANAQIDTVDASLRLLAIMQYSETANKHPHPAVEIKETVSLDYDEQVALMWCIHRLPNALQLNKSLFEKHAKSVSETAPLKFVSINPVPKAYISADLGAFIQPAEDANSER